MCWLVLARARVARPAGGQVDAKGLVLWGGFSCDSDPSCVVALVAFVVVRSVGRDP